MTRRSSIVPLDGGWKFVAQAYFATREQAMAEQERFAAGPPSEPMPMPPNCGLPPSGYAEDEPPFGPAAALMALHDEKDEP